MNLLLDKLKELKAEAESGKYAVVEIQRKLVTILLSQDELPDRENVARKYDNEMERIIYTLREEKQIKATVKLLDDAICIVERL